MAKRKENTMSLDQFGKSCYQKIKRFTLHVIKHILSAEKSSL